MLIKNIVFLSFAFKMHGQKKIFCIILMLFMENSLFNRNFFLSIIFIIYIWIDKQGWKDGRLKWSTWYICIIQSVNIYTNYIKTKYFIWQFIKNQSQWISKDILYSKNIYLLKIKFIMVNLYSLYIQARFY